MDKHQCLKLVAEAAEGLLEPEQLGELLGRMMAKMHVFIETKKPIDVVKTLREEWGE